MGTGLFAGHCRVDDGNARQFSFRHQNTTTRAYNRRRSRQLLHFAFAFAQNKKSHRTHRCSTKDKNKGDVINHVAY